MANIQILPYAQQIAAIQRQRKLADLLQEQGMQPSATQMVSGIAIPTSPWETASKLAQSLAGAYAQSRSDKEEAEAKKQARDEYKQNIQDFISAIGPQKAYTSTPVMEQSSDEDRTEMAPKMQWSDETGQMEPVQDWKETFKPGLSRNQAIARLLEMQGSENPYIAAAAPTLTGLLPKQTDATDLFNKLDMSKLTPESVQEVLKTGDIGKAKFAEETLTPYQKAELYLRQKEADVRAAEAAVDNARSDAQLKTAQANLVLAQQGRDQSRKEFEYNYPNLTGQYAPAPVSAGQTPSGMTTPQPAGQPTSQQPVQQATQPASKPLNRQDQMAYNKDVATLTSAAGKLQAYRDALNKVGKTESLWGAGAGTLDTAYANALSAVRTLQNTGVFNPGEAPLLEKALADARTLKNISDPKARERILAQLDAQFEVLNTNKFAFDQQYQQEPKPIFTTGSKSTGETAAQRAKRLGL